MEINNITQISELYSNYIRKTYEEKLDSGNILWTSAHELLSLDRNILDSNQQLGRQYLIRKVAGDLLRQVERMAYTKQYDCSPVLKEYTYMAFHLAYEFCAKKADRRLLPFLAQVMYYENFNEDKTELSALKAIYDQSLKLEQEYIDKLLNTDRPEYATDIWGF